MTLNDIRNRSGLLILVIGVAMLGFILTDLMNSGTSLFQKNQNLLLKIDNKEITFTGFEKELEKAINVKFANNFGSVNINESQRNSERDLLWNQKLEEVLFSEKFSDSGIIVGDVESWDLISGEITGNQAQLFGYFFRDQTESGDWNQYEPEMIQNWIEMGSDNPQWFRYLFFKENTIRERAFLKYYNAVKKGLYATNNDAKAYYKRQTQTNSGKYIFIPMNFEKSEIEVSEKEIKQYYKNNQSEFQNYPNREISYFVFNLTASNTDKEELINEMNGLIGDKKVFNKRTNTEEIDFGFENTVDVEGFINQYGDNKYIVNNISKIEFEKSVSDKKLNVQNSIIRPYIDKNVCKIGRIISSNKDSLEIVYLTRDLYASDQTLNKIYSDVYDIISNNKVIDDIESFANKQNIPPRTVKLEKMDQSVPGLGSNRQIVRWAFNEETNLNEPMFFDLEDKYIIAVLSSVSESDIVPIELAHDNIKSIIENQKKGELIIDKINHLNSNSLLDLANEFSVTIKEVAQLKINSDIFSSEGYNPEVVGAFIGSKTEEVSSPVVTEKGVFVFQKDNETSINYPSNMERYQKVLGGEYDSKVDALLVETLKENKEIIDNRFNFY